MDVSNFYLLSYLCAIVSLCYEHRAIRIKANSFTMKWSFLPLVLIVVSCWKNIGTVFYSVGCFTAVTCIYPHLQNRQNCAMKFIIWVVLLHMNFHLQKFCKLVDTACVPYLFRKIQSRINNSWMVTNTDIGLTYWLCIKNVFDFLSKSLDTVPVV